MNECPLQAIADCLHDTKKRKPDWDPSEVLQKVADVFGFIDIQAFLKVSSERFRCDFRYFAQGWKRPLALPSFFIQPWDWHHESANCGRVVLDTR